MPPVRQPRTFWIGLLIYALSFIFVAVANLRTSSGGETFGFHCAYATLLFSWEQAKALLHVPTFLHGLASISKPLEYFAFLVSGWINPFFLTFVVMAVLGRGKRLGEVLRIAIPFMVPFCWIIFLYEHLLPREGHFLWIAGMLLALFSANLP
jgi:hypothetical protein